MRDAHGHGYCDVAFEGPDLGVAILGAFECLSYGVCWRDIDGVGSSCGNNGLARCDGEE